MESSVVRTVARWALGAFLALAGTAHLTVARGEFRAQVPLWVPMGADAVVVLSGVVEIVLGLALIALPSRRVLLGAVTALFFVAVFPGNLWQYLDGRDGFGLDTDAARLTRLFFQPLLIAWALWSTGAFRAWRRSRGTVGRSPTAGAPPR